MKDSSNPAPRDEGKEPVLSEQDWRTTHNALAIYRLDFVRGLRTEHKDLMAMRVQVLMDKVRDNYIAKPSSPQALPNEDHVQS